MRSAVIFLLIASPSMAQQVVTEYFTLDGIKTEKEKSYYYLVGKKTEVDDLSQGTRETYIDTVKTFYTSTNRIRSKVVYKLGLYDGSYESYYENGNIMERGTYLKSQRIGLLNNWYKNGVLQLTRYYPTNEEGKFLPSIDYKIMEYSDSLGNKIVENGNGYCKCKLSYYSHQVEEGKVIDGLRDSTWLGSSGDFLLFTEQYDKGRFIEGINYSGGSEYKYNVFEEQPQYEGGKDAMQQTVVRYVRYPREARKKRIQGLVYISFVVRSDGSTSDHKILKSIGGGCDEEALNAVKMLTDWKPGRQRGTPVNVRFVYPVNFKL